jgi:16S rRNA (cytosine1402-N4)-methyltransferase
MVTKYLKSHELKLLNYQGYGLFGPETRSAARRQMPRADIGIISRMARWVRGQAFRQQPYRKQSCRNHSWSTGMMMGRDGATAVDGGLARHVPVLLHSAMEYLNVRDGGVYIDATFGAGGYSRAILAVGNARVIGIDRDRDAIAHGADLVQASGGRLTLVQACFSELEDVAHKLGHETVDGVVLDLGVSSMQLDEAARGFSFRLDGPLDMRMGGDGPSAADLVARASERDLAFIIATLGEERHARAVARAIAAARKQASITTTRELSDIVTRVVHVRPNTIHPATRTFQALRIFVNEELTELAAGLMAAERILKPSGRLVAVAFHSLEDRIVKTFLAERSRTGGGSRHHPEIEHVPTFRVLTKRPLVAEMPEVAANPRARSAKLRAAERGDAAPRGHDAASLLPRLPSLAEAMKAR